MVFIWAFTRDRNASPAPVTAANVGDEPEGVTISPDGAVAYLTSEQENAVTVIDVTTDRIVRRFEVGKPPRDATFAAELAVDIEVTAAKPSRAASRLVSITIPL